MIRVPQSPRERREWEDSVRASLFLPFQSRWLRDKSRLKIAEKCRQVGFSWCDSYDTMIETAGRDWPYDAWVSSRDQIQAMLYGEDCKTWAKAANIMAGDLGESVIDDGKKLSALRLPLSNGRSIWSLSSNVDAQAGKRGTRKLDEFALNAENRRLYAIAKPGIQWGGRIVIFSTHRGTGNFFNELVREIKEKGNPKGFSLHTVTFEGALREGLLVKLKQKWAGLDPEDPRLAMSEDEYAQSQRDECPDEETWLQEYCCVPADDASAFVEWEEILKCCYRSDEAWQTPLRLCSGPLYVGVDIGRRNDLTVIWVAEKLGDTFYTRLVLAMQRARFEVQERELYSILDLPGVHRCCIDDTGIGIQFAERAVSRYGPGRVEAVTFTPRVKEELAYPVKRAFEEIRVRIPDDRAITADIRAIKKEVTAAGNVRFTADRGPDGHADRFWALALAIHAGTSAQPPGRFGRFDRLRRAYPRHAARRTRAMIG